MGRMGGERVTDMGKRMDTVTGRGGVVSGDGRGERHLNRGSGAGAGWEVVTERERGVGASVVGFRVFGRGV